MEKTKKTSPVKCQPLITMPENGIKINCFYPSVDLRYVVKFYWIVEVENTAIHPMAKISPSGNPELIFHFGDTISIDASNNNTPGTQPESVIAGQITQPVFLEFGSNIQCICVKLQPYALSALFNINSNAFTNRATCLSEVMPSMQKEIFEQLSEAKNDHVRIIIIEEYLRKLLKKHNNISEITCSMIDYVKSNNNICFEKLRREINFCSRTLQRKIMSDVGITPKMLLRIIRFNKAFNYIKHNQNLNLQDISFILGYYDLAHLINEFKEFSGLPPVKYFKKEDPYNNFFAGII
ncbi:MAG: helix-turn-helix domain-containing protein [Bacteroidales bacterium]